MLGRVAAAVALAGVAGCSAPQCFCTPRTTAVGPPPAGYAQLEVLSPSNTQQIYIVDMDTQQLVATARIMRRMTVDVPAGAHRYMVLSRGTTEVIQANFAPGQRYSLLIRYLAVPFGPEFGVLAMSPRRPEWSRLAQFRAETTEESLVPPADARSLDRAVRRVSRRLEQAQSHLAGLSPEQLAERTFQPGDGVPTGVAPGTAGGQAPAGPAPAAQPAPAASGCPAGTVRRFGRCVAP